MNKIDKIGFFISFICAIHCMLVPILLIVLPMVGFAFLAHDSIEWGILVMATIIGTISVLYGHKKHKNKNILLFMFFGIVLLFIGRVTHDVENIFHTIVMVVGGSVVAASHFLNSKLCKSCRRCCKDGRRE